MEHCALLDVLRHLSGNNTLKLGSKAEAGEVSQPPNVHFRAGRKARTVS